VITEETFMPVRTMRTAVFGATLLVAGCAVAQQQPPAPAATPAPAANPLDVVPDKMPFSTPYGPPITLRRAQAAIQAAMTEAEKRGWMMNIAVVDSGANLVTFARMDGAQLASVAISEHKARASVKYRRPTRVFEDALQKNDYKYIMTLDDIIASRGGIPLVEDGKLIGAIGCSGGTGSQDEVVCTAGAATINK
jgi:glc operon protein GlcG